VGEEREKVKENGPVSANSQEVETADDDVEDSDPHRDVDFVVPVLNDERSGGDFGRESDGVRVPVAVKGKRVTTLRDRRSMHRGGKEESGEEMRGTGREWRGKGERSTHFQPRAKPQAGSMKRAE
jgi:hypothetical protein